MSIENSEKLKFQKRLENAFQTISPSTCNILLIGNTGAGKSSLTNQVFGSQVTKSGVGQSITKEFASFESKDHQLRLYDSRGIEIGNYRDFFEKLEEFLRKQETIQYQQHIHCVWILIDGSLGRVDIHWKKLCETILSKYSILFILNKVDLINDEGERNLKSAIEDMAIPNLVGIFSIVSIENFVPTVDACISCNSKKILLDSVDRVVICKSCEKTTSFDCYHVKNEMKMLIEKTISVLPRQQQISFISSQHVHMDVKKEEGNKFVKAFQSKLFNEIGLFDADVKKAELVIGLCRIYGLSGDIDISMLTSINMLISNITGLFQIGPLGELLKCGTKIASLYLHAKTLNQILYECSLKMVEDFSQDKIQKVFDETVKNIEKEQQ